MAVFEHPRDCAKFVAEHSEHVQIDPNAVISLAKKIKHQMKSTYFSLSDWKKADLHPKKADEKAIQWIFFVDALNFSFWPDEGKKFSVTYNGQSYTGYWSLCAAVNRALDEGIPIIDVNFFKDITVEKFAHILRADQPGLTIPLVKERVQVLHECARVLIEEFDGSFLNCIRKASGDAEQLLRIVYERFTPFQDHSQYKNKTVLLLKRAQILIADIWACFEGKGWGQFRNIETITMFADYRVPQVLVYFDVLHYSQPLLQALKKKQLLLSGDQMEVEIRAQSIHAVELLKEALDKLTDDDDGKRRADECELINSTVLDFYLWNFRQDHREAIEHTIPFHRVRSINY